MAIGRRAITKSLELRYLRPLPLGEEIALWGVCEPAGDGFRARFTITARGKTAVEGTAHLISYEQFERGYGQGATASGVRKPLGR